MSIHLGKRVTFADEEMSSVEDQPHHWENTGSIKSALKVIKEVKEVKQEEAPRRKLQYINESYKYTYSLEQIRKAIQEETNVTFLPYKGSNSFLGSFVTEGNRVSFQSYKGFDGSYELLLESGDVRLLIDINNRMHARLRGVEAPPMEACPSSQEHLKNSELVELVKGAARDVINSNLLRPKNGVRRDAMKLEQKLSVLDKYVEVFSHAFPKKGTSRELMTVDVLRALRILLRGEGYVSHRESLLQVLQNITPTLFKVRTGDPEFFEQRKKLFLAGLELMRPPRLARESNCWALQRDDMLVMTRALSVMEGIGVNNLVDEFLGDTDTLKQWVNQAKREYQFHSVFDFSPAKTFIERLEKALLKG